MDTTKPTTTEATASSKLDKRILIAIAVLVVIVVVLAVVLLPKILQKDEPNTNPVQVQPQPQPQPTPQAPQASEGLAPGQTNPNIVGFGQTFECDARSDHEFYRTDQTLVVDPKNPEVMYVNIEYRGFHKTTDGGKNWTKLTNGIKAYGSNGDPNKPCYSEYPFAVIDSTDSNRVLLALSGAGGTLKDMNAMGSGILESLDGGASFKQIIRDDMNGYVSSIALDPSNPKVLYYGSNSSPASYKEADQNKSFVKTGLVYKQDNGNWTELPTTFLPYTGATGVHVNPASSNELMVFTMSAPKVNDMRQTGNVAQMGLLKSSDGGKTWKASHPLPTGYEAVLMHDVAPKNFKNIFVTPFGGPSPKSFYSTDGGVSFKQSNKFMDFVAYDPNDASGKRLLGYAWQSTNGPTINKLFESTDAGATWHEFSGLPSEIKNIADKKTLISNIVWHPTDRNTFFMSGASGLVWKTTNNGKTWTKLLDYTQVAK